MPASPHLTWLPTPPLRSVSPAPSPLPLALAALLEVPWAPLLHFSGSDIYLKMEVLNQSICAFSRYYQIALQMDLSIYTPAYLTGEGLLSTSSVALAY